MTSVLSIPHPVYMHYMWRNGAIHHKLIKIASDLVTASHAIQVTQVLIKLPVPHYLIACTCFSVLQMFDLTTSVAHSKS